MSKHTPGPWTGITGQTTQFGSIHTDDACIATVEPGFTEETKANIRLIAAAPDLLAALEGVVETPLGERPTASALLAARAALAKAGGAK